MNTSKLIWPDVKAVDGVRLGVASAGIKKIGRKDIVLFEIEEGACVAGVFTQNAFAAAPVIVGREHLQRGDIRYLLINSGNANACTGKQGMKDAAAMAAESAQCCGAPEGSFLVCSTGRIGEQLPMPKLLKAIAVAGESVRHGSTDGQGFSISILTSDTKPKTCSASFEIDGRTVTIGGAAKGAGTSGVMILARWC